MTDTHLHPAIAAFGIRLLGRGADIDVRTVSESDYYHRRTTVTQGGSVGLESAVGLSEAATGATISRVGTVHIRRSTLASPDAARLIAALDAELTTTFPEPGATHFSLSDAQVVAGEGAFLVAYLDDVAVGCGAVRRLDEATAEVKRIYVDPSVRGRGIGRALVEALEREARLLGVTTIVLETGTRLTFAIKLYEAMGYAHIPLFGEYLSSPNTSLCFGKSLA